MFVPIIKFIIYTLLHCNWGCFIFSLFYYPLFKVSQLVSISLKKSVYYTLIIILCLFLYLHNLDYLVIIILTYLSHPDLFMFDFHWHLCLLKIYLECVLFLLPVTGESVHAPRHRNSTYIQMVRWSIYETRRPKHPHLQIRHYQWRVQGSASPPRYMESWQFHGNTMSTTASSTTSLAMSTGLRISAVFRITARTALLSQDTTHSQIRYSTIAPSSAFFVPCWHLLLNGLNSRFLIWLDSIVFRFY